MGKRKSPIDIYKSVSSDGFLKVTSENDDKNSTADGGKAARLLLLLGTDEAARVMSRLNPREAEVLARQIADTRRVDTVEAGKLLEEFGDRFGNLEVRRARGGVDAAREILTAAFGSEKAAQIVAKAVPEASSRPFAFLNDLDFNQITSLFRKENAVTLSLVMSYIDPAQASRLLESLPEEERGAIVLRMARTEKVSREVISTVETTLQKKLRFIAKDNSEEMDGRSALADILRFMDLSDEQRLLGKLEEADPSLAEQVKEKLYTMDSVLHLKDKDLQNILRQMGEKDIALLLKGQTEEIRERINESLSSRRRLMVADEGDIMGLVPRSEADTAVRDFLEKIRSGEEDGTYIIIREEADLIS